jgi:hypothetical protein
VNRNVASRPAIQYSGHRCTAGSGARSPGPTDAAFPEFHLEFPVIEHVDKFDIGSIRKGRVPFEFRTEAVEHTFVEFLEKQ